MGRNNQLLTEVNKLLSTYCDGCFVHRQLRKEYGRRSAHHFCINKCTVGNHLRKLGNQL
ncbi:zinc-finger domain-containing protein [Bacillus kwashiorkori]|uniref:zinc-finger domain-containing protein n=1 Tax=Bacillus kwashiorkori TaxID=1522318 RepID=UPI00092E2160|nr:zinc-finger domain-containing protein [Bacillus kwashiorkori]